MCYVFLSSMLLSKILGIITQRYHSKLSIYLAQKVNANGDFPLYSSIHIYKLYSTVNILTDCRDNVKNTRLKLMSGSYKSAGRLKLVPFQTVK